MPTVMSKSYLPLSKAQGEMLIRLKRAPAGIGPVWVGPRRRTAQALVDRGLASWAFDNILVATEPDPNRRPVFRQLEDDTSPSLAKARSELRYTLAAAEAAYEGDPETRLRVLDELRGMVQDRVDITMSKIQKETP